MSSQEIDEQLADLQARLTFQEESIDVLNRTVAQQAQDISELQHAFKEMARRIHAMAKPDLASETEETPPPHY